LNRRSGCLDNNRASARARVAAGVICDVVDGVGCYLRRIDQDVSGQNAVDKCPAREIITLVVMHDYAEVGVGIANVDSRRIVALDDRPAGGNVVDLMEALCRSVGGAEPERPRSLRRSRARRRADRRKLLMSIAGKKPEKETTAKKQRKSA
jgi:hypothetical protein